MEKDKLCPAEIVTKYRTEVERLLPYLPWLIEKRGKTVGRNYKNDQMADFTMSIPVYDSTLLAFVKTVLSSSLTDKNYAYIYSRNRLLTSEDERDFIRKTKIEDFDILIGILSKYILRGITKGAVWSEGVQNGVLAEVLIRMKELIEYYSKPMN